VPPSWFGKCLFNDHSSVHAKCDREWLRIGGKARLKMINDSGA